MHKRKRAPYAPQQESLIGGQSQPRVDPIYGQRSVFTSNSELQDQSDLDLETDAEALAYLQSVRTQANSLPTVFTALPTTRSTDHAQLYSAGHSDTRAFYSDGAYVASALFHGNGKRSTTRKIDSRNNHEEQDNNEPDEEGAEQTTSSSDTDVISPQEAALSSLLTRYDALRTHLSQTSQRQHHSRPSTAKQGRLTLPVTHNKPTFSSTFASATLLASVSPSTALYLLPILSTQLTVSNLQRKSRGNVRRLGVWTWGLLARLASVELMDNEEVGAVREVGKKAGAVVRSWKEERDRENRETNGDGDVEGGEASEARDADTLAALKEALIARLGQPDAEEGEEEEEEEEQQGRKETPQEDEELEDGELDDEGLLDDEIDTPQENRFKLATEISTARPSKRHRRNTSSSPPSSRNTTPDPPPKERDERPMGAAKEGKGSLVTSVPEKRQSEVREKTQTQATSGKGRAKESKRPSSTKAEEDRGQADPLDALAILDLVISVVGVRYGQRDLLGVRERIWGLF